MERQLATNKKPKNIMKFWKILQFLDKAKWALSEYIYFFNCTIISLWEIRNYKAIMVQSKKNIFYDTAHLVLSKDCNITAPVISTHFFNSFKNIWK